MVGLSFRAFLFVILILGGAPMAYTQVESSTEGSSDFNQDQVDSLLRLIETALMDPDPRKRSSAVESLAHHHLEEVKKTFFNVIENELKNQRPNKYILQATLNALADDFLHQGDVTHLNLLKQKLEDKLPDEVWLINLVVRLKTEAANNEEFDLERLPQEDTGLLGKVRQAFMDGILDEDTAKAVLIATEGDLTKSAVDRDADPLSPRIIPRKKQATRALEVLARMKGRIPVFTGEAGVGKTALAEETALKIYKRDFEDFGVFIREFPENTVVLKTSAARISRLARSDQENAQASALEMYLSSIKEVEKKLKVNIIIYIDEMHTLSTAQLNALKPYADALDGTRLIGSTTHKEYMFMVAEDRAVQRRLEEIDVPELSEEETFQVIKEGWASAMERRYHVRLEDDLIREFIPVASELRPDLSRPEAQIKTFQDFVIAKSREFKATSEKSLVPTIPMIREYAGSISGVPINPNDTRELVRYLDEGRQKLREKVIGQNHLVEAVADSWQAVLTSDPEKAAQSIMVLGSTGIGKSLTAATAAEVFLGSKEKVLTVDCTAYMTGDLSLNSLIGAPPGTISSDKTKGVLPEFLSGVGKHSGVIILNEVDKASPDLQTRLMEMIDSGILTGGDGRQYRLRRHLVVMTSNRNADRIFNRNLGHLLTPEEMETRATSFSEGQLREFFIQSNGYAMDDKGKLKPEIVNRIDKWVVAKPLVIEEVVEIGFLEAKSLRETSHKRYRLDIELSRDLVHYLAEVSFVPADGARPVRKKVERSFSQIQSVVWKNVDDIENKRILAQIERTREGDAKITVDLVDDSGRVSRLGTIDEDDPTKFMALADPRFVKKLQNLRTDLQGQIYGQDEAIEEVVTAVQGRAARPFEQAPVSIWLMGQTGNGKTALGKALANSLFSSPERARSLKLGDVQSRFDFNDIFSPPKGIVGSDELGRFEEILQSFPDGGVIIWDEIGNMGRSALPNEREALFMKLYDIFGEGTWTSPLGKTYDLSKYVMVLTSNDGEELFAGVESPDLIQTIRRENAKRGKLRHRLQKKNVPEAFLNRISTLVLTNPLVEETREFVTQKFLSEIEKQYEETYPMQINYTQELVQSIGNWFFPPGDNARGAERFVKRRISDLIAEYVIENRDALMERAETDPLKIEIRLEALFEAPKPWAMESEERVEPKFKLSLVDLRSGEELKSKTHVANGGIRLTPKRNAWNTSIHEAGHALVNEYLGEPRGELAFLTIESRGSYGGYARYDNDKKGRTESLNDIIKAIAVMAAGRVATEVHDLEGVIGWAGSPNSDKGQMDTMAFKAIVVFGLVEGLTNLVPDIEKGLSDYSSLDESSKVHVQDAINNIVGRAVRLAHLILSAPDLKQTTKDLAQALMDKGSITQEMYQALIKNRPGIDQNAVKEILRGAAGSLCAQYVENFGGVENEANAGSAE